MAQANYGSKGIKILLSLFFPSLLFPLPTYDHSPYKAKYYLSTICRHFSRYNALEDGAWRIKRCHSGNRLMQDIKKLNCIPAPTQFCES